MIQHGAVIHGEVVDEILHFLFCAIVEDLDGLTVDVGVESDDADIEALFAGVGFVLEAAGQKR